MSSDAESCEAAMDVNSDGFPSSALHATSSHAAPAFDYQDDPIAESSTVDVAADRQATIDACRVSLDFLAAFILTDLYEYGYPRVLKAMWDMICGSALKQRGKFRFALGIPRGFSKTIMMKLYVVWCVLFSEKKFILIVGATEGHAINFISDVEDMLDHPNVRMLFGDWRVAMTKDSSTLKVTSFRGRSVILAGIGQGGSPRGFNIKYVRPDLIIMDDIQKREDAPNQEMANALMVWMLGTLMKSCHPRNCTYIFVGNMYPYETCVLRKLKHSSEWLSLITGAITADGESIWPEHRDIDDLLQELAVDTEQGHPEIFFSEVMNDEEAGTVSGIDTSKIPDCPAHLDVGSAQGGCVIIDPSLGRKKSDDVAIGAVLFFDGIPVLRELSVGKFDPGVTIQKATFLAVKYGMHLIVAEEGGYQATLVYWFNQVFTQAQVKGIEVRTVSPAGMMKNARIREMLKSLLSGKILVHRDVRSAVIYQISQWNPLKANNKDDILDVMAYMLTVLALYPSELLLDILIDFAGEEGFPEASFSDSLQVGF